MKLGNKRIHHGLCNHALVRTQARVIPVQKSSPAERNGVPWASRPSPSTPHFAASAEPCRIWRGEAAAWLRRAERSSGHTPPPPGRTSWGSGSCGCWCCAWPSRWGVSGRSSPRWSRWAARSRRAIPGRHRSAWAPAAGGGRAREY